MLNGYQPPTELCNLELPPLKDIDPIQHYRIISVHPIYGTFGNLQTLNSTMLQKAFLEMKVKRNLTLDNEARNREQMALDSHIKLVIDTRDLLQLYCLWLLMVLKPI